MSNKTEADNTHMWLVIEGKPKPSAYLHSESFTRVAESKRGSTQPDTPPLARENICRLPHKPPSSAAVLGSLWTSALYPDAITIRSTAAHTVFQHSKPPWHLILGQDYSS